MKLYDTRTAPNPRRVRIFLAEKGWSVPTVPVDITAGEQRRPDFAALNPSERVPVLELDDGTAISESVAICRYVEEMRPEPPLFGTGAVGRALVEMWQRRIEWELFLPITMAFRHTHPKALPLEPVQVGAWGELNRGRAAAFLPRLDRQLAGQPFVCGDAYSIADITALVALDFMRVIRVPVPPELSALKRWHEAVSARSSAAA